MFEKCRYSSRVFIMNFQCFWQFDNVRVTITTSSRIVKNIMQFLTKCFKNCEWKRWELECSIWYGAKAGGGAKKRAGSARPRANRAKTRICPTSLKPATRIATMVPWGWLLSSSRTIKFIFRSHIENEPSEIWRGRHFSFLPDQSWTFTDRFVLVLRAGNGAKDGDIPPRRRKKWWTRLKPAGRAGELDLEMAAPLEPGKGKTKWSTP